MSIERPRGTPSIRPRQSIPVAVATGRKPDTGFGILDKDRFFLVNFRADGKGKDARRALHPAYAKFNALPESNDKTVVEKHNAARRILRGYIVHADEASAYWSNYRAQVLQGHQCPSGAPSCEGNGKTARRWMRDVNDYATIPCPGDKCEHQRPTVGNNGRPQRAACTPYGCIVFQLRFDNAPCLLAKYESRGFETVGALEGFFQSVRDQAATLGVENPNLYGLPFVMDWSPRSNAQAQTKWYALSISPDLPPGMTLADFLLASASQRRELAKDRLESVGVPTVVDAMDDTEAGNLP